MAISHYLSNKKLALGVQQLMVLKQLNLLPIM
jgi:hypothetical protein